jgi:hypothetical protein
LQASLVHVSSLEIQLAKMLVGSAMIRIDCQRFLICGQRFVEMLQVVLTEADVVSCVGVARLGLDNLLQRPTGTLVVAGVHGIRAKVIVG